MPFSFLWVKRLQLACKFIYFLLFSLLGFWWTLDLWSFCDPYCGLVWGFSFLLRNFCTHLKIYNLEWSSSKPFDFFFIFLKCYISLTLFFLSENVSKCLRMLLEWNLWFGVSLFLFCVFVFFNSGFQSMNFLGNYCLWCCLVGTVSKYRDTGEDKCVS